MKSSFSNPIGLMGISIACMVIALSWMVREKILLNETASQHAAFMQTNEQLMALKNRWLSTKLKSQKLNFLQNHSKLTRKEQSDKQTLLEYGQLDAQEMDKLMSVLLNDTFLIKSLVIKHESGLLKVEIEQ